MTGLDLLFVLAGTSPAPAARPADDQSWTLTIEPYLWLAGIDGDGSADSSDASINVVGGLSSFFMARMEARSPDMGLALIADGLTLDLKDEDGFLRTETSASMVEVGLAMPILDGATLEALAGARFVDLGFDVDVPGGNLGSARESWVDPWIGARGFVPLGGAWSMKMRGDVGGFGVGSEFTWQTSLSFAAQFSNAWRMEMGYRALSLDFEDDDLDYDAIIYGPWLSVGFSF